MSRCMPCRRCELAMALRITHRYTRHRYRYPQRCSGRPHTSLPRHHKDTHPTIITPCHISNRYIRILRDITPIYNPWTTCGAQRSGSAQLNGLISKTRLVIYKVPDSNLRHLPCLPILMCSCAPPQSCFHVVSRFVVITTGFLYS